MKIQKYIFINNWEIEYKVGKNYFVMAIEEEDLENVFEDYNSEKHDNPRDFLETDEQVEKLLTWFHTEFADTVEPIDLQFSQLCQINKKGKNVTSKTNLKRVEGNVPTTIEMINPAYVQAIVARMERLEREIQKLKEENRKREDIILTTKQIEHHYKISPKTINQARVYNRIVGRKINGKEWGYEKREVERYIENSKNHFKNRQYAH